MTKKSVFTAKFMLKAVGAAAAALGIFALSTHDVWSQTSCATAGAQSICKLSTITVRTHATCFDAGDCKADQQPDAAAPLTAYLSASPAARALQYGVMGAISQAVLARLTAVANSKTADLNLGTGLAGSADGSPWNVWAAASYNGVGYSFAPLSSSGGTNNALFGVDYGLTNGALVGVVIGADSTRMSTSFNAGSVNTIGYTVAPYFAVPLGRNLTLDGSLGFGSGRVNANVGGDVTGNTDERRSFSSLALTYTMNVEKLQINGMGVLMRSSTNQKQFTLTNAQVVANSNSGAAQMRAGVRASYGSGDFVPFMGVSVSSNLRSTNVQAVGGQDPVNAKTAAYVQAGLDINAGQKISGSMQVNSELRSQIRNNGVGGTVSVKF